MVGPSDTNVTSSGLNPKCRPITASTTPAKHSIARDAKGRALFMLAVHHRAGRVASKCTTLRPSPSVIVVSKANPVRDGHAGPTVFRVLDCRGISPIVGVGHVSSP